MVTALVGLRLVTAVVAGANDARAWARTAAAGEQRPVRATARVLRARETRPGRWSVTATLGGCSRPCAGARVGFAWEGREAPRRGERWRVRGRLRPDPPRSPPGSRFPPPGLGPGGRRGWLADVRVGERRAPPRPLLAALEAHLRERITARFGPRLAPLVTALTLGDRSGLDPALTDAFAATGTVHLLAVSGLHVGLLAGCLALLLAASGTGRARRAGFAVATLAGYAALVGARPSVVRAVTMCALVLVGRIAERRVSRWQPWGVAAVLLLAWRPGDLFDLGFGLSFCAVAGLLAAGGPLARWLEGAPSGPPRTGRLRRGMAAGLAATTAATLGTLPVQAAAFGYLAPAGFALNPVAVPLTGLGLPLAWAALAADAAGLDAVAGPLARVSGAALGSVAALASFGASRVDVWVPGPAGWALAAGGLLTLAFLLARAGRRGAAGLAAVAGVAVALAARPPTPPGWEVVWLDVGQGDAVAIHFPDGATWLVDAGRAYGGSDAGRRVVVPYLRRRGVRALRRLVTTHPDLDHVGGAASVLAGIPVRRWASGGAVGAGEAYLSLIAARGARRVPAVERLRAGDRLREGDVAVDVLHPAPGWVDPDPYTGRIPSNEGSVVLLMSWGACRVLLTGDLGEPGERLLMRTLGDSLRAGLLHVGHHGSRGSTTAGFLARVRPRDAVISVGAWNRFGHPAPETLARLAAAGARVHRTDRTGSIAARCGPGGWRVGPETGTFPAAAGTGRVP